MIQPPPRLPKPKRLKALVHAYNWLRDYVVENVPREGRGTKLTVTGKGTIVEATPPAEESEGSGEPIWL